MIKVITKYKGKILGCGIDGWQVGELIPRWVFVLTEAMKTGYIALMIAPHPSLSQKLSVLQVATSRLRYLVKSPKKLFTFYFG